MKKHGAPTIGNSDAANTSGTLSEHTEGQLLIGGDFKQSATGSFELNIGSKKDILKI
ncbi:hypothetical protein M3231_06135 [Neobacillus mesonae]|nr:hypothetical protein [Neobacillus mesonae]